MHEIVSLRKAKNKAARTLAHVILNAAQLAFQQLSAPIGMTDHCSALELPELSGLAALPTSRWAQLRERLCLAGLTTDHHVSFRTVGSGSSSGSGYRPLAIWHARRRGDAASHALRLFVLRDPVAENEAAELLERPLLEALVGAGVLRRPEPHQVVSSFDLRIFRGRFILCDELSYQGDAVFGAGYGTVAFCGASSRQGAIRNALDLGCGAGAVALWLSEYADRVAAVDINPRALAFVKINAALNGVSNIEPRQGDLFEAVEGETFDFIASQPPYVPHAPGLRPATYLFGGPRGDELVTRVLAELPRYLHRRGRGVVVFEQAGKPDTDAWRPSLDAETRALFIVGGEVDADAYSLRLAAPELLHGLEAFHKAVTEMREHLANTGIRGMSPAICIFEKAADLHGWNETLQVSANPWNEVCTAVIDRLMSGQALLHQPPECLKKVKVRIPDGSVAVRSVKPEASNTETVYLGLPPGYLVSALELSRQEWEALQNGQSPSGLPAGLVAKAARIGLVYE